MLRVVLELRDRGRLQQVELELVGEAHELGRDSRRRAFHARQLCCARTLHAGARRMTPLQQASNVQMAFDTSLLPASCPAAIRAQALHPDWGTASRIQALQLGGFRPPPRLRHCSLMVTARRCVSCAR